MNAPGVTPTPDVAAAWNRFWFLPASATRLAQVRLLAGLLGSLLLWTWSDDLVGWFGGDGIVSGEVLAAWRSPWALPAFDLVASPAALRGTLLVGVILFALVAAGAATPWATVLAALFHASLLHRGPMLAGPADDCVVNLTWCTAAAPATRALSHDRVLAGRGRVASAAIAPPVPSWRARVATGLLQVHASVIALAAAIAQLKGDVWWDGTAAWWLAARAESRVVDLTSAYAGSTYLMNLATHAIPAFEAAFAVGLWASAVRPAIARLGLVAWPAVGVLVGEPFWGLAMAVFAVPFTGLAWGAAASPSHAVTRREGAA